VTVAALRVLVCDDSRAYAGALQRVLEYEGDIEVLAVCGSAEDAIAALPRLEPDLVTMDVELPGMGGLDAVGEIMSSRPLPILVLSAYVGYASEKTAAALAAGALDALDKDDLDLRDPAGTAAAALRRRIKVLSQARVIRHPLARLAAKPHNLADGRRVSVVGVCASLGGPQLLMFLLKALPAGYPIPLLIVQHIASGFTEGLARWLDEAAEIPVRVAEPGTLAAGPGAWLAPDGAHLTITRAGMMMLDRHTVAGRHRPSGDVLLSGIAAAAGRTGAGVVLSGIGRDGAAGAAAVRRSGGLAIAQDEGSSAVFGMPKAAIELGVDVVLPPSQIAACLLGLQPEPFHGARG
jgi:two-component system, chemotaxis family, protein-glutamate methylesterase/glutaminase